MKGFAFGHQNIKKSWLLYKNAAWMPVNWLTYSKKSYSSSNARRPVIMLSEYETPVTDFFVFSKSQSGLGRQKIWIYIIAVGLDKSLMSYRFLPLLSTVYSWYGVHQIEFWENSCVLKRAKIVQTSYFYWPAVIKWKSLKNRTIVIHSRRNFNGKNILQYQVTFCEVTWFDNNSRLSKKGVNSNFFAAIKSTF